MAQPPSAERQGNADARAYARAESGGLLHGASLELDETVSWGEEGLGTLGCWLEPSEPRIELVGANSWIRSNFRFFFNCVQDKNKK
jgi:hypothetical protein